MESHAVGAGCLGGDNGLIVAEGSRGNLERGTRRRLDGPPRDGRMGKEIRHLARADLPPHGQRPGRQHHRLPSRVARRACRFDTLQHRAPQRLYLQQRHIPYPQGLFHHPWPSRLQAHGSSLPGLHGGRYDRPRRRHRQHGAAGLGSILRERALNVIMVSAVVLAALVFVSSSTGATSVWRSTG